MALEQLVGIPSLINRRRLLIVLGLPFAMLLGASLVSWPWRALGLVSVGTLTPVGALFIIGAALCGMFAIRRGLPMGYLTWLPAGQGAIVLLTTGFLARSQGGSSVAFAAVGAYVAIYVLALVVSVLVSSAGMAWGLTFISLFLLTQATRFPVFSVEGDTPIAHAEWFTLAAAFRSVIETGVLIWLARRLIEAAEGETKNTTLAIIGLVLAHGFLAGWEDPLVRGTLDFKDYIAQVGWWVAPAGAQIAISFGFIRIKGMWSSEPQWATPAPPPPKRPAKVPKEAVIIDDPSYTPPSSSARRRRRRKR